MPPTQPDPELRTIRLPIEMWAALDRVGRSQGCSAAWLLRVLVWRYVLGRPGEPRDGRAARWER